MKYWESMNSKWGFNDGDETPMDATLCRLVYVRALNAVAERRGSKVRCVCYDRPGVHNSVIVIRVDVDFFNTLTPEQVAGNDLPPWPDGKQPSDDAWDDTVEECKELGLDEYVVHEVKLSPEFDEVLANIKTVQVTCPPSPPSPSDE